MDYQIGGNHYMKYKIQPLDVYSRLNLDAIRGNILKYLVRWKDKNGIEDLKKALQYAEVLKEKTDEDKKYIDTFLLQFINEGATYDNEALPIIHTLLKKPYESIDYVYDKLEILINKLEKENDRAESN